MSFAYPKTRLVEHGAHLDIGAASAADVDRLIEIDQAASSLFAPTGLLGEDALKDHVPAAAFEQAIGDGSLLVARHSDGTLMGFCLVSERPGCRYIDQISVDPAYGRQGIGRALMQQTEADARLASAPSLVLSTFRDLPWNAPFYASLGFRPMKRHQLKPFMLEIEREQARHMDVSKRIFMRKRLRKPLIRVRKLT